MSLGGWLQSNCRVSGFSRTIHNIFVLGIPLSFLPVALDYSNKAATGFATHAEMQKKVLHDNSNLITAKWGR